MAFRFALAVSAGLALSCAAASAAETENADCYVQHANAVGFTAARAVDKPTPRYPRNAERDLSEGWVLIEHAITAKGEPHRIEVIDAMGSKEFVLPSIEAIKRWRFTPASRNGVAVDQSLHQTSVLYLFTSSGREADHATFIRKYNLARSQLRASEFDKALQTLEEAFAGRVNLYESAMGSFMFALAYREKADWERALYHSRHSVIESGRYLEYQTRGPAYALLVELEARTGNYKEAMCELQRLRKIAPDLVATDSSLGKTVASIDAVMKDPKPLGVPGKLAVHPLVESAAVWRHQLLRRKFWFADVKGDVKSFRLACSAAEHEAPFDAEMLWNVPQEAGDCILRVEGAPGATFTLVEEW